MRKSALISCLLVLSYNGFSQGRQEVEAPSPVEHDDGSMSVETTGGVQVENDDHASPAQNQPSREEMEKKERYWQQRERDYDSEMKKQEASAAKKERDAEARREIREGVKDMAGACAVGASEALATGKIKDVITGKATPGGKGVSAGVGCVKGMMKEALKKSEEAKMREELDRQRKSTQGPTVTDKLEVPESSSSTYTTDLPDL